MPMKKVVKRKPAKKVVKKQLSPAQAQKKRIALLAKKYTLVKRSSPKPKKVVKKKPSPVKATVCLEGYKISKAGRCVKDKNYKVVLQTFGPKNKSINEYSRAIGPSYRARVPTAPMQPLRESAGVYFKRAPVAPQSPFAAMLQKAKFGLKKPSSKKAQQIQLEKAKTILAKAGVAAKPAQTILKAISKKLSQHGPLDGRDPRNDF